MSKIGKEILSIDLNKLSNLQIIDLKSCGLVNLLLIGDLVGDKSEKFLKVMVHEQLKEIYQKVCI
jgi:hypothetical protein